MVGRRLTVAQAADALGISANAVRMRVRRGSLPSERDAEGRVWVLAGPDEQESVSDQHATDQQTDQPTNELTEELRDRVAYLERQVEAEREASRELRRLLAGMIERVPQLEPPQEPQTGREEAGREDEPAATTRPAEAGSGPLWHGSEVAPSEAEESERRPWWQRWFGG